MNDIELTSIGRPSKPRQWGGFEEDGRVGGGKGVYLRMCGQEVIIPPSDRAMEAVTVAIAENEKYCSECGQAILRKAVICPKCGCQQEGATIQAVAVPQRPSEPKSKTTALVLCFFLGLIGAHHFYLGRINRGLIHLAVSCTGLGISLVIIATIIDFFLLVTLSSEEFDSDFNRPQLPGR